MHNLLLPEEKVQLVSTKSKSCMKQITDKKCWCTENVFPLIHPPWTRPSTCLVISCRQFSFMLRKQLQILGFYQWDSEEPVGSGPPVVLLCPLAGPPLTARSSWEGSSPSEAARSSQQTEPCKANWQFLGAGTFSVVKLLFRCLDPISFEGPLAKAKWQNSRRCSVTSFESRHLVLWVSL